MPTGKIDLSWRVERNSETGSKLILNWRELGGPKIATPGPRGFGSTLIERSLAGAKVERLFNVEGLTCTIELNLNLLAKIGRKRRVKNPRY